MQVGKEKVKAADASQEPPRKRKTEPLLPHRSDALRRSPPSAYSETHFLSAQGYLTVSNPAFARFRFSKR